MSYGTKLMADQIMAFVKEKENTKLWLVSLFGLNTRKIIPISARTETEVGCYIKTHIPEFLIFFQHLAKECDELDLVAFKLRKAVTFSFTLLMDSLEYSTDKSLKIDYSALPIITTLDEFIQCDQLFVPIVETVLAEFPD